jgi:mannose-6-phosphate isomerase
VLRGGLTAKHVDVPELLRILKFKGDDVQILMPQKSIANEFVYPSKAREFVLSVIKLKPGAVYQSLVKRSIEILICTGGTVSITDLGNQIQIPLPQGASVGIPAAVKRYAISGQGVCHKAAVPV